MRKILSFFLMTALLNASNAGAGHPKLMTIFLRHDQTRTLDEIQAALSRNKFYEEFPPMGTTVVDWHVVMGIGQILVIETPESQIAEVKKKLKQTTRGAFDTQIYSTENAFPRVAPLLANPAKKSLELEPVPQASLLLTIVLRPNPGLNVQTASKLAARQELYRSFPPPGSSSVNWYEAKGLGEIVVLEFPASVLRSVNLPLERSAWKAYATDFYVSYDFYPIARDTFKLKNTAKKSLYRRCAR